jgi:hypothetical protein
VKAVVPGHFPADAPAILFQAAITVGIALAR